MRVNREHIIYPLLGVFLLLGIWGQDAYATTLSDSYVQPGYHIIENADHEAEVIAYRLVGTGTRNLTIKDTMTSNQEQYKVIRIVDGVFKELKANDVSIAGSVKEIGNEAFASAKLTGIITMEEGVEVLGEKCFQNFSCTRMKLPNSITTIGALAFHNTGVSQFKLPTALQSLAADAFDDADSFTFIIPKEMTNISSLHLENYTKSTFQVEDESQTDVIAYLKEKGLHYEIAEKSTENNDPPKEDSKDTTESDVPANSPDITKPDRTEDSSNTQNPDGSAELTNDSQVSQPANSEQQISITDQTNISNNGIYTIDNLLYKIIDKKKVSFVGCKNQTKQLRIPATVQIAGMRYKVTRVEAGACKKNTKVCKIWVGSQVTVIGAEAFAQCKNLRHITIGSQVKKIGAKTFYKDTGLSRVTFRSSKLSSIGKKTFYCVPKSTKIQVPKGTKKKYQKLIQKAMK